MKHPSLVKIPALFLITISFVVLGILDYNRGKDKRIVQNHLDEHHPVINALFAQKIRLNQELDNLLVSWPPSRFSRHDIFTTLYYVKDDGENDSCCGGYSTYILIIAMNDNVVKALAVEGVLSEIEYVFFNKMDKVTEDIYWTSRLQSLTSKK